MEVVAEQKNRTWRRSEAEGKAKGNFGRPATHRLWICIFADGRQQITPTAAPKKETHTNCAYFDAVPLRTISACRLPIHNTQRDRSPTRLTDCANGRQHIPQTQRVGSQSEGVFSRAGPRPKGGERSEDGQKKPMMRFSKREGRTHCDAQTANM